MKPDPPPPWRFWRLGGLLKSEPVLPSVTYYFLPITSYLLPLTYYLLPITSSFRDQGLEAKEITQKETTSTAVPNAR